MIWFGSINDGSNECSGVASGSGVLPVGSSSSAAGSRSGVVCFRRFFELSEAVAGSAALNSAINWR